MTSLSEFRRKIDSTLKTWQWWVLASVSWLMFRYVMAWLEGLYKETLFPVTVIKGQTAFDGELIKSYYAVLLENGTMGKYLYVQIVDFGFMLTMFAAMATMTIAAYRSLPKLRHLKNVAWAVVFIAPLAPFFDALENIVSFFMIANPQDFANWLAYPYSTFAFIKYALSGFGFFWTVIAAAIALATHLYISLRMIYQSLQATR